MASSVRGEQFFFYKRKTEKTNDSLNWKGFLKQ